MVEHWMDSNRYLVLLLLVKMDHYDDWYRKEMDRDHENLNVDRNPNIIKLLLT